MIHKSCPLCGEENVCKGAQAYWDWKTRFGNTIEADRCSTCGLVYLNPYDDPDQTRAYYVDGTYRDDVAWDQGKPFDWVQHRFEQGEYAHQLFYWVAKNMDWAIPESFAHVGADPGPMDLIADMYAFLCPDTGVKPESVSDIMAWHPEKRVGLAAVCQTIDHLVNPAEALTHITNHIQRGGYLYVDFVDFDQTQQLKWDHPSNFNRQSAIYAMREVVGGNLIASRRFGGGRAHEPGTPHIGYLVQV